MRGKRAKNLAWRSVPICNQSEYDKPTCAQVGLLLYNDRTQFKERGAIMQQKTIFKAGLYLRLSKDDERQGESVSIETQRAILTDYCLAQGFTAGYNLKCNTPK